MDKEEIQPTTDLDFSQFLKDVAWAALVKFATARLIAALPFLGWGPMGWITGIVVSMVGAAVYDAMAEAFKLEMIEFRNEQFQRQWDTESVKLKIVAKNKGVDSPEFKEQRKKSVESLTKLVSFTQP